MDFNFLNQKITPEKGKKGNKGANFSSSIAGAIFIFMIITALYLVVSGDVKPVPEISISELAKSVSGGEVKKILV